MPSFEYENIKYAEGYTAVCGTDEAGRGPLCGPVVAAAVILPKDTEIEGLNDSKKLTEKKREKRIKELIKDPSKIASSLKNPTTFETVEWGLKHGANDVARASAYLLSSLYNKKAKKVMLDAIMDFGVASEIKRVIVYALIVNGFKEKFGMLVGNFYVRIKPKKLSFEKKFGSGAYLSAYALCMSRLAFLDIEELDKIAEAAESVYEKLSCVFTESDVTNDDLAALMLYACGYKRFKKDSEILAVFNIGKDRLRNLKVVYNGGEE